MNHIDNLIQQLQAPDADVRIAAIRELGARGMEAQPALTALLERFLVTEDRAERKEVGEVIDRLDPQMAAFYRFLHRQRQDEKAYAQLAKSLSLEEARRKIGDLVWSMEGSEPPVHEMLDEGIYMAEIGLAVPDVIPDLVKLLMQKPTLRNQLSLVLRDIAGKRPELGEAVVPLLAHKDTSMVDAAANIISGAKSVGEKIQEVIPILIERCRVEYDSDCWAGDALVNLATTKYAQEIVDALGQELKANRGWRVTGVFGRILSQIAGGDRVPEGIRAVVSLLRDNQVDVRDMAVNIAHTIGAPEVVAALGAAMQDPDQSVRINAVTGLSYVSAEEWAAQLVPYLIVAMDDADPDVRWAAVKRLGTLGPAAAAALPVLRARQAEAKGKFAAVQSKHKAAKARLVAIKAKRKKSKAQLPGKYEAAKAVMVAIKAIYETATERIQEIGEAIRKIESAPAGQ